MGRPRKVLERKPRPVDPAELRLCGCAGCGRDLAGIGQEERLYLLRRLDGGDPLPAVVSGHVRGRPYCRTCLHQLNKVR
jgi:hypothetical protein